MHALLRTLLVRLLPPKPLLLLLHLLLPLMLVTLPPLHALSLRPCELGAHSLLLARQQLAVCRVHLAPPLAVGRASLGSSGSAHRLRAPLSLHSQLLLRLMRSLLGARRVASSSTRGLLSSACSLLPCRARCARLTTSRVQHLPTNPLVYLVAALPHAADLPLCALPPLPLFVECCAQVHGQRDSLRQLALEQQRAPARHIQPPREGPVQRRELRHLAP